MLASRLLPPAYLSSPILSGVLSAVILYGIAFPVFYLILKPLPTVDPLEGTLRPRDLLGGLCVAVTLMLAGNYLSTILTSFIGVFMGDALSNPVAELTVGTPWYINLIFVGILAPIMEEIIFRRVLCRRLLPLGEGYAIVLSSAAFSLCHGNLFQSLYAFALGCLFALIYIKTGKLRHSIFYHIAINLTSGIFASWLMEKLNIEELLTVMEEIMKSGSTDMSPLIPFAMPLMILTVYDIVMYAAAFVGLVLLIRHKNRIVLSEGLLPPPKKGRVANVFLNAGTAAAIAAFTVIFLLSILPAK